VSATDRESRKYFIAVVIMVGGIFIVAAAVLLLLFFAAGRMMVRQSAFTGAAHLFVPGPFRGRYAIAADLDVPRSTQVLHSSPSLQFDMVRRDVRDPRYLEAGLIRMPSNGNRLQGFFNSGNGHMMPLPDLSDGPHRVALEVDGAGVTMTIDGLVRARLKDERFWRSSIDYISVGTFVGLRGEEAAGTVSHVQMRRDGETTFRDISPTCIINTNGINYSSSGDGRYVLTGKNRPGMPLSVTGCNGWRP
jgi:hypothetical protein